MNTDLAFDIFAAAREPSLLIASDFDGTLAPFVDDPFAAKPHEGIVPSLLKLAACPATVCAVISSRTTADLAERMGHPLTVTLLGSYGRELYDAASTPRAEAQLSQVASQLQSVVARYPGSWIEQKTDAIAFHVRTVTPVLAPIAISVARAVLARLDALHVIAGDHVVEWCSFRPDKSAALNVLRLRYKPTRVIYLGDSHADERVFASALKSDITICVGKSASLARHKVASPDDIARLLHALAAIRADLSLSQPQSLNDRTQI